MPADNDERVLARVDAASQRPVDVLGGAVPELAAAAVNFARSLQSILEGSFSAEILQGKKSIILKKIANFANFTNPN